MTASEWGIVLACGAYGELLIDVARQRYWWARFDAAGMAIGILLAVVGKST